MQDHTYRQALIYERLAKVWNIRPANYNDLPLVQRQAIAQAYHKAIKHHKSQSYHILMTISDFPAFVESTTRKPL